MLCYATRVEVIMTKQHEQHMRIRTVLNAISHTHSAILRAVTLRKHVHASHTVHTTQQQQQYG
jgi:hypothetical protein